ncbi:MAG: glycosyltransferase family 39 protein, partial [Anaerolineae bacterium]|nr:glycosyltransferase family 39 protein [Anaerolineae bacterium]
MDADPVPLHGLTHARRGRRAPLTLPALVLFLGLTLRLFTLGIDARFHPDEALFAAQARLVSHDGDWLLRTTDLDKPPLTLYVTALSFRLLGPTEFAARLPNVLFSGLSVALVYRLAQTLYRDRAVSLLAALLCALSPYLLAFTPTAFTDGQATFWVLLAALLAARDRWRWAGGATALAFAAKTTALWAVPLIVALGLARTALPAWRGRDVLARLVRYALPLLAGMALLALWDLGRAPRSFFSLGYTRNSPDRLIRSDELWPRLEAWAHWLGFATGSPALNALLAVLVPAWLVARLPRRIRTKSGVSGVQCRRNPLPP